MQRLYLVFWGRLGWRAFDKLPEPGRAPAFHPPGGLARLFQIPALRSQTRGILWTGQANMALRRREHARERHIHGESGREQKRGPYHRAGQS